MDAKEPIADDCLDMMQRRSNTLQTGETKSRHSMQLSCARKQIRLQEGKKKVGEKKNPAEAIFKRPSGSLQTGLRAESERINRRENIWYILSRDAVPRSAARNAVSSLRE